MSAPPRYTVLIVEDEAAICRLMAMVLRQHAVSTSSTVAEAWALIESGLQPDCILCDVNLKAAGSGTALYERVRDSRPDLLAGFVWMSGGRTNHDNDRIVTASGLPHLMKPIANVELREAVLRYSQR